MIFDKKVFGGRVQHIRKQKQLTLQDIATKLNTDKGTISNLESGKKGISVENLVLLSDFLNISIDYLVGLSDDPTELQSLSTI